MTNDHDSSSIPLQVDLQIWYELFMHDCERKIPGTPANVKQVFNHKNASKDVHHYYDSYNLAELVTMTNLVKLALTKLEVEKRVVDNEDDLVIFVNEIFNQINLLQKFKKDGMENKRRAKEYWKEYDEKYGLMERKQETVAEEDETEDKIVAIEAAVERLRVLEKEKEDIVNEMGDQEMATEGNNEELNRIFAEMTEQQDVIDRLEMNEDDVEELRDEELEKRCGEDIVSYHMASYTIS